MYYLTDLTRESGRNHQTAYWTRRTNNASSSGLHAYQSHSAVSRRVSIGNIGPRILANARV
jgi:hypothetical protein